MFVKKLVEKASIKKPGGNSDSSKWSDVEPRLIFHYGIPSGATKFAYDPVQKILAISTRDGRLKLFGSENSQVLLESPEAVPSKFLQFLRNKSILLNVTSKNQIEVWDVDKRLLCHAHAFKEDITAFAVMQHSLYMYVGDSVGNVSVLKLDQEACCLVQMKYTIPFSAFHGNLTEVSSDIAVLHILPQPTAESKRVLIVFRGGLIMLWDIRESKSMFSTGGSFLWSQHHETKKITSACWACSFGSKVAVGYSNGEILIWSIPASSNLKIELASDSGTQTAPISKLNLGYKLDKVPIASLKWFHADGKASRLYVMGAPDSAYANLVQVILLNEHTETRTIKLALHVPEPCIDMEILSSTLEQSKRREDSFVLLGKSGCIHAYDDCLIEKYLLQSQTRSSPSLPKEVMVKMPFADSSITAARFITHDPCLWSSSDEDYILWAKNTPFFPFEEKYKDGTHTNSFHFTGFTKVKNLYITGHSDGAVNFWDVSCPFVIPLLALKQQSEDDFSLSGIPVTALYFDENSRLLISGDQSGMVWIYKFKPEPYATESIFISFQGSSKRGNNYIIQSVKHMKVNGSVFSININYKSGHLAIGSDKGYVSVVNMEGPTMLYQQHITSEISTSIISLQFETCSLHGFEKNVLVVATKDSSLLALDSDTGNLMSDSKVHPKKPSRALFMQILDGHNMSSRGSNMSSPHSNRESPVDDAARQSFILICCEKAVYVYSLIHVIQGVKKVHYKKKFQSSACCGASTFCANSNVGLLLLFSTGRIEIRSLPELSLLRDFFIRGFTFSPPKLNSLSDSSICCSDDGDLLMVNADQEMFAMSVLQQKASFRLLDHVRQVYRKELILSQEGLSSGSIVPKEKKKGLFSSVIKDMKGNKPKAVNEVETEDTKESIEELSTIFSTANFACDEAENKESLAMVDDEGCDLDIDDIDLDDPAEKPKDQHMLATDNKQKLANKFQAFKCKIKQIKMKNEKKISKEDEKDEKPGAVDQIKKKYGFSSSGGDSSAAKIAENKLHENVRKLQGINLRTTEMEDTAKSFSSMAKEVLRIAEKDKRSS